MSFSSHSYASSTPDPHTYRVIVTTYSNGQWFVHAEATHGSRNVYIAQGIAEIPSHEAAEEAGRPRATQWIAFQRRRKDVEKTRQQTVVGEV